MCVSKRHRDNATPPSPPPAGDEAPLEALLVMKPLYLRTGTNKTIGPNHRIKFPISPYLSRVVIFIDVESAPVRNTMIRRARASGSIIAIVATKRRVTELLPCRAVYLARAGVGAAEPSDSRARGGCSGQVALRDEAAREPVSEGSD